MRDNPEAVLRDGARIAKNLWAADPTLWTEDQTTQRFISNRLGWLTASDWLRIHLPELQDRVDRVLALLDTKHDIAPIGKLTKLDF